MACACTGRAHPAAGATSAPLQRHPAPPPYAAGGTGVADHRPVDALPALQVRPLADQRGSAVVCASTWTATTTSAIRRCREHRCATWSPAAARAGGRRLWRSAWKAAPRDRFIGWSVAQREARLQLVVNNARFLLALGAGAQLLPRCWLAAAALPDDWQARYGTDRSCWRPSCSPTASASYRAANWTHVGQMRIPVKKATHSGNKKPPGGWSNPDTATIAGWLF